MQERKEKIRLLIVDDSIVSQRVFSFIAETDDRLEIVGYASNGQEAIESVKRLKPDIVSMDIEMPIMDGKEATRQIMQICPVPIVISSNLYDPGQQELAMEVLEAGAVIIIPKPTGPDNPNYADSAKTWLRMVRTMSEVKVIRRKPFLKQNNTINFAGSEIKPDQPVREQSNYSILVIGASAGGPESVKTILSKLQTDFPLPVMIVQHIDKHFSEGYRLWLQSYSKIPVLAASEVQQLLPGNVYLSPGEKHLVIKNEGLAILSNEAPLKGHRPSVGHLFKSAAMIYGNRTIAVILSGMGNDGAEELKLLRNLGALTFAQNEASSLVFGMPGEAVRLRAAKRILPPEDIANEIINLFNPDKYL